MYIKSNIKSIKPIISCCLMAINMYANVDIGVYINTNSMKI